MKIVHVSGYFMESASYQENLLTRGQSELGHKVYYLTSKYEPEFKINKKDREKPLGISNYFDVLIYRLPEYFEIKNKMVFLKNLIPILKDIKPDIIFFHDVQFNIFYGLYYKWLFPNTKIHIDIHSDWTNARHSVIGPTYHFFWRLFFKIFIKKFEKVFCIAPECITFAEEHYKIERKNLIHLPLPGNANKLSEKKSISARVRKSLGFKSSDKVIIHTGKMPEDKETKKLLEAFVKIKDPCFKLIIAGSIEDEFKPVLEYYLSSDSRIKYVGWVNQKELKEYFLCADILVQPGTRSNSQIDAICSGLPVILSRSPQAEVLTSFGNGILLASIDSDNIIKSIYKVFDTNIFFEKSIEAAAYYHYRNNAIISLN